MLTETYALLCLDIVHMWQNQAPVQLAELLERPHQERKVPSSILGSATFLPARYTHTHLVSLLYFNLG